MKLIRYQMRRWAVASLTLQTIVISLLGSPVPAQAAGLSDQVANHIVLSEIHPDRLGLEEFIELYNPTNAAIDLSGWSIQYKGAFAPYSTVTGATTPNGAAIPAHGFYLFGQTNYNLALAPDSRYNFRLDLAGGNVYLVNSTNPISSADDPHIIDRLGYGTADSPEGQAPANPLVGQSLERKPGNSFTEGNGIDTNNNALDWLARTSGEPQNSQSTPETPDLPTLTIVSPAADSYTNQPAVTIAAKASDSGSGIADVTSFRLWVDGEQNNDLSYDQATQTVSRNVTVGEGTHNAKIEVTDRAGFSSIQSWNFTVDTIAPTVQVSIANGATKTAVLDTTIKLMAEDSPLGRASGISQMQVAYDGVLDNEPWEPFQPSLTRKLMNKEGFQVIVAKVRDRAGNESRPAQVGITLEFTPVTAPISPISSTVGRTITITWQPVAGASYYIVRYSDGQTMYSPIVTQETFAIINNLDPAKTYSFDVAAVNGAGTVSSFTHVTPPQATTPKTEPSLPMGGPTNVGPNGETLETGNGESTPTVSPSPSPSISPTPTSSASPGQIKGGEDTGRDWTRVIVALSILIIAAGVATGGWYLYQWWTTRPQGKGKGRW